MGSRLQAFLKQERGSYTVLAKKMLKYRKPRKNGGKDEYNLVPLFEDGHNVTLSTLTGLMQETGMSLDFFVDFEQGECPLLPQSGTSGNNNIINSSVSNDLTVTVEHLHEVIRLKDELIADKERIITLKDAEIEQWKKRYDDLLLHSKTANSD
ncbi:MAG: hypothetical protein ACTTKJ_06495 [Prevotella koreensis]